MQLTERDIAVIRAVATYYVLSRQQVQRLCFPADKDGRITRKRLQGLVSDGFVSRHSLFVYNAAPSPVYYPTRKGLEQLAAHFDDECFLAANTACPAAHLLYHWLAINDTRLLLETALAKQSELSLAAWINEHEVVDKRASAPERRFHIYTLIQEHPRLVCAPDAAFLLKKGEGCKAFFLEQDRNTTAPKQLAASKTPGYAALDQQGLHRRIFPQALPKFLVLCVTVTPQRRDALRKAVSAQPGCDRWRFVAGTDLAAESFLNEAIVYPCEGEPTTLVKGA